MKQDEMKIVVKPLSFLKPAEYNPRKDLQPGDPEWEKIENSIRSFGYVQPILINSDGTIISGHQRFKIMQHLGYEEVQCVIVDVDKETEKAMNIAMNKIDGDWDIEKLGMLFGEIDTSSLKTLSGFEADEINELEKRIGKIDTEWFEKRQKDDRSRQDGNQTYNDFLDKFEIAKTTDDCYTPDNIYDAICCWVEETYKVKRENFVRPFYPNGDYQTEKYKKTDIVVDNPPFSILAQIVKFYCENDINFFVFAPTLSIMSAVAERPCCALCTNAQITYENGAKVPTSFITNLDKVYRFMSTPDLFKKLREIDKINSKKMVKELPKYDYPVELATGAGIGYLSAHDTEFKVTRKESKLVRVLDAQKEQGEGKAIYGSGYLISEKAAAEKAAAEKAAAEKAAAEKAAAEKAAAEKWQLSEREWNIVRSLGGD